MADQADGSIIIDTEINSDGFKAGSAELLAAIKALSTEVKNLGQTLKELFSKPLTPEINTGGAEDKVAALEAKVQELQASLEELQNTNGNGTPAPETATPQVNIGGVTEKASGLQREIDAVNSSVQKLEPTFQKAMSGSESAMTSFEGKASTLESKIAELQERLDTVGRTQFPTQQYQESLDDTTALEAVELFPAWKTGTVYTTGRRVRHGGILYTVLQDHTAQDSWTPDAAPSLFAKVLIPDPDVIPEWEQPDSTNPYKKGDRVRFNGKVYESLIDNNVWSPSAYPAGWREVSA